MVYLLQLISVASLIIILGLQCVHAFFIQIDANAEECYFDRVAPGTKLGLMFEVVEGGFLDIDVKVNTK